MCFVKEHFYARISPLFETLNLDDDNEMVEELYIEHLTLDEEKNSPFLKENNGKLIHCTRIIVPLVLVVKKPFDNLIFSCLLNTQTLFDVTDSVLSK
ncbi:hypothetical protein BpHYR1_006407 [Brachionus plicatilis]|uniref:Uncharacterized protein n=1 Tax=Brachionus plicatilis TaxID=10195 RepID=A0A3M7SGY2_BRAPC|nr:hypothetical protein BpHYR1_006407 [Brachionus plicatilis]